jgi:hypothetical protein
VSITRASALSLETNPKYAEAWLESLSPVDNLDAAREVYQSLRTFNRAELEVAQRLELLSLYRRPVSEIAAVVQPLAGRASFPLPPKTRRFIEFIRQLHVEMAQGYKSYVQDLSREWVTPWRRRQLQLAAAERALYYLGEVLVRSYQFYLPYPAGVWRDVHALYRLVESYDRHNDAIDVEEKDQHVSTTISRRYRRMLLLGIANPYQMPLNECDIVYRFVERWMDEVKIETSVSRSDTHGWYLIDMKADAPPVPLERAGMSSSDPAHRLLDVTEFIRTLRVFLHRLERGEPAGNLQLGIECLDAACQDMLQRLHRMYSQTVSRRHSRIKRHETVFICAGIGATHFFAGGQRSFFPPAGAESTFPVDDMAIEVQDEAYVELDEPAEEPPSDGVRVDNNYRIDRWQVRDLSPQGLLLAQDGKSGLRIRVGDVLGIQRANVPGQWSIGLVRWVRAQNEKGIEVGVELISPEAASGTLRTTVDDAEAVPVLLLPAVEVAKRPASVVVPRGLLEVGGDYFLTGTDRQTHRVRVLEVVNRTGSIEQAITGKVSG